MNVANQPAQRVRRPRASVRRLHPQLSRPTDPRDTCEGDQTDLDINDKPVRGAQRLGLSRSSIRCSASLRLPRRPNQPEPGNRRRGRLLERLHRLCAAQRVRSGSYSYSEWALASARRAASRRPTRCIADYFEPRRRARALADLLAWSAGRTVARNLVMGAYIAHAFSWRAAFFTMGVAGLMLAPIMLLVVRDPPRAPYRALRRLARCSRCWRASRCSG